jgi:hypothetical protein
VCNVHPLRGRRRSGACARTGLPGLVAACRRAGSGRAPRKATRLISRHGPVIANASRGDDQQLLIREFAPQAVATKEKPTETSCSSSHGSKWRLSCVLAACQPDAEMSLATAWSACPRAFLAAGPTSLVLTQSPAAPDSGLELTYHFHSWLSRGTWTAAKALSPA